MNSCAFITADPDILGGQSVFTGTRVPIESLFDYLETGVSLDEFLDEFPTVTKEQATALLFTVKHNTYWEAMKTAQESMSNKLPPVTIDPALNEYQDKILFPEKLARANEMLKTVKLPPKKPRNCQ